MGGGTVDNESDRDLCVHALWLPWDLMTKSGSRALPTTSRATTFAELGRALGLREDDVVEALCHAVRVTWTGARFRYLSPTHQVGDDETSRAAIDELRRLADGAERRTPCSRI